MSRRRPAGPRAALVATLLAVLALVSGCGADTEPQATTTDATTSTLATAPQKQKETGTGAQAAAKPKPALRGPLAFHVTRRAQLRRTPGGKVVGTIKTKTNFKSPTILAVSSRKAGWVRVRTSLEKHDVGWLPASAGSLFEEPRSVVVDLSARTITVFHRGKLTDRYRVAIGTRATPTPTGRFAVTDRLKTGDENGDYGCCILALNAHQPKIAQGWGGGDRVAIHATPHTWTIGNAVSHGCVRASNKALHQLMRKVRLGTPVRIKA
jgi:lipoprotein-anchoring transpeptidase ErfK/SrfK